MNLTQNLDIKGVVTLTLRDAETLDIISERTVANAITSTGISRMLSGQTITLDMYTSTTEFPNIRSVKYWNDSLSGIEKTLQSSIIQGTTLVQGNPNYFERIARFNQPPVTKQIKQIMLMDSVDAYTKVRLDPPCEQTDTEILDITYRIQFNNISNLAVTKLFTIGMINQWINNDDVLYNGYAFPRYAYGNYHNVPNVQYNHIRSRTDFKLPTSVVNTYDRDDIRLRKIQYNIPMVQSDYIGKVFGSILFGSSSTDNTSANAILSSSHILPGSPNGFVNSPIQPIHNHSVTATLPFLDVNNLAAGSGTMSLNGDSWTNPDYPKYTLIEINNTGDVGTARYSFRQRNITGFSGNTYYSDPHTAIGFKYDRYPDLGNPSIEGAHGLKNEDDLHQLAWDGRTILNADLTGITLIDIINGDYVTFDATTTPALPITNKSQIVVDDNKNIWVSDATSGLYKISDPYGTPTITKMTNAVNNIPLGGDSNCTCVSLGLNNTVWALFDGGLGSTVDGGITWTIYDPLSAHPFSHVGLTDGNWTLGSRMYVDKESPDQQLAISYTSGGNEQLLWWSTVDVVSVGPLGNQAERLKCSNTGGLWFWDDSSSNGETFIRSHRLLYGTTNSEFFGAIDVGISNKNGLPVMAYDYYNSPHVFAGTDAQNNNGNVTSLCTSDRKVISQLRNFGLGALNSARQLMLNMEDSNSVGKGLYVNRNNIDDSTCPALTNICPNLQPSAYNLRYSPYEEMVWDKYQWNGSAWVKNYHSDAIDTSGNSNNATRHNFDVENYMFTGRSIINVTPSFTTGTFNNIGTFVFTLIPDAKLAAARTVDSEQELPATIFEINDGNGNRLILKWDDGLSNIVLEDETNSQIITAQPANGVAYRVIVTLNTTDAKVYIDGVLSGTLVLTGVIDLSNVTSNIISYIGARTHAYSYNKRFNVGDFYRGQMNNIQLWNIEWDQTDVTNDMVDITSVIASKPAINLISRYELTQSLVGLETKATHNTQEALLDGVTLNFTNGTTSPAFVNEEYYTVGIVDGFLKDNAMTITYDASLYVAGSTNNFTTITNTDGLNTVLGVSGSITEKVVFFRYSTINMSSQPGELISNNSSGRSGQSMQSSLGDMSITFSPSIDVLSVGTPFVGFATEVISTSSFNNAIGIIHNMKFNANGTVDAYYNSTIQATGISTYVSGDVFKIERVGTTVAFYKVVLGVPILLFTSGTPSSGLISCAVGASESLHGFYDMVVTYVRSDRLMAFGDSGAQTGLYDPEFIGFDNPVQLFANGIPVDIVISNTLLDLMTEPAAGTVSYNSYLGIAKFNAAEIGTTITGSVTLITDLPK